MNSNITKSISQLYNFLYNKHWNGSELIGSDPGLRFNSRIGRFIKSYFSFYPWKDDYYSLQCQSYWIQCNWMLFEDGGKDRYSKVASNCAKSILRSQTQQGYWHYPFPGWKDRIATVECCYGALGLLQTYKHNGDQQLLAAVKKWYDYMIKEVGFQKDKDTLSINYFANKRRGRIPNNSTLVIAFLVELFVATNDDEYLKYCDGMIKFLETVQTPKGELPYMVKFNSHEGRPHFLCFQYNAFQFLDLTRYWEITKDTRIRAILIKLLKFLENGLKYSGEAKYNCFKETPVVNYYGGALGAAFLRATELGFGDYSTQYELAFLRLLNVQRPNGAFTYSYKNYKILSDKRSYPRYQAMILKHLLMYAQFESNNSLIKNKIELDNK